MGESIALSYAYNLPPGAKLLQGSPYRRIAASCIRYQNDDAAHRAQAREQQPSWTGHTAWNADGLAVYPGRDGVASANLTGFGILPSRFAAVHEITSCFALTVVTAHR